MSLSQRFGGSLRSSDGDPGRVSAVQINRSHILLVGLVLFFMGVQFRLVQSFTLSEGSSRFIAAQMGNVPERTIAAWPDAAARKVVQPPNWLGLALMSVGSVLTLKSLSMRKGSAAKSHSHRMDF
jgi:hypothetical protein